MTLSCMNCAYGKILYSECEPCKGCHFDGSGQPSEWKAPKDSELFAQPEVD